MQVPSLDTLTDGNAVVVFIAIESVIHSCVQFLFCFPIMDLFQKAFSKHYHTLLSVRFGVLACY